MRKSILSIQVYAELRAALGHSLPAGELLSMAERLVDAATRRELIDRCGRRDERLELQPTDIAMQDGGWALLDAERSGGMFDSACDDQGCMPGLLQRRISHLEAWA